jgi:hypothetical protein
MEVSGKLHAVAALSPGKSPQYALDRCYNLCCRLYTPARIPSMYQVIGYRLTSRPLDWVFYKDKFRVVYLQHGGPATC